MSYSAVRKRCIKAIALSVVGIIGIPVLGVWIEGCALLTPPKTSGSVESRIVLHARHVVAVSEGVLTTLELLTDQKLVQIQLEVAAGRITADQGRDQIEKTKADARQVIGIVQKVAIAGGQLADVLRVIDAAQTPGQRVEAIQAARQLLLNTQRLVQSGLIAIGDDTTRNAVGVLLGQVSDALLSLAMILPQG